MKRKRHTPEQIVAKLRQAEAEIAKGASIVEVAKQLGISEHTYYRWRNAYGGMPEDQVKRLKELEKENSQLKKLVADLSLDKQMLKELAKGNF